MNVSIQVKLDRLKEKIRSLKSAAVLFSGGVDSAVLTAIAHEELQDRMIAITGSSPSVPSRDMNTAVDFCRGRNIPHKIITTCELEDERYVANPDNRCFYCKSELFSKAMKMAKSEGFKYILEGTNTSEVAGHRPGIGAAEKCRDVVTPYVDLGITKDEVREFARVLKLEVAEKPSTACLSSRLPTGTRIDADILKRIDEAENFLLGLGIKQVRLRYHGDLARIEIDPEDFESLVLRHGEVTKKIKALGFGHVTLDLVGYRVGGGRG